jgi:hypothetical protein
MRSPVVMLFMKDDSPVGIWACCRSLFLGGIKRRKLGHRASCAVHFSKFPVRAGVLLLIEALAQAEQRQCRWLLSWNVRGGVLPVAQSRCQGIPGTVRQWD